jgi:glycosyltransferase involved in cell wall biosynthesis
MRNILDSILASQMPDSMQWEVLLIDNNSIDQTSKVAKEYALGYPHRFRYVFEATPGKSYALNTGIRESIGDILAFVDDDVTVRPEWLWNLTKSLDGCEWVGSGGRTLMAEHFEPPSWLALNGPHSLGGVLAAQFDLGDQACELTKAPFGANMAFRKEMFEKVGLFRTDMGPSPHSEIPRPNEDTEFGRRVLSAGYRLRYEPAAIVYHPVTKERVEKDYFLSWWFDYGRASIREAKRRPDIWGIQRRYWSLAKLAGILLPLNFFHWAVSFDPAKRFFRKCWVWVILGQIAEVNRLWAPESSAAEAARE